MVALRAEPDWLRGLEQRMAASPDDEFLARLPALRGGFLSLAPADRARLLTDRLAALGASGPAATGTGPIIDDPVLRAAAAAADRAGREAVARLLPQLAIHDRTPGEDEPTVRPIRQPPGQIPLADRWRLVLGVKGCTAPKARRAAFTLDQLYGTSARPGRGYQEDLAGGGGAAPERDLEQLRKLARRITDRLAEQLATRLRPALTGLSIARPTRRRSRQLDFGRTLDRNLDTAHRRSDGRVGIAPRRLIYRTPARRHMDWHLIFVVDVSGSMEASVIYSALTAAIFSSLPALDVRFFAFSTEVIDFSERVGDPLSLLMEVQVGGGTHIGLGLRAAREAIKNPPRTLLVLVTDFEEGVSVPEMLAEVRALAESGVKLIGLAALDDDATPRYHSGNAAAVAAAGMAVAAVSPERLAAWIGDQIRANQR